MQKYGLIGYPLKHSFSIGFFNEKFKSEGIDAEYVNFEIPEINDFMEVIEENPNLCGLNVTIPYKEQVIPFLDELDKDTAKIGAVNVIKIIRTPKRKIKLVGYNSDIIGFSQSIQPLLQPYHKKALILGTGGSSKAIYHGLKNLGIVSVFVSRTKKEGMLTYEELTPEVMAEHTVIVNCTPVRTRCWPTRLRSSARSSATTRSSSPTARSTTPISTAASISWPCGSRCTSRTWA